MVTGPHVAGRGNGAEQLSSGAAAHVLVDIADRRIDEIAGDLKDGAFSQAELLGVTRLRGRHFQLWLAGQLDLRSRGFYTVTREDEVIDGKRPDVRLHCAQADAKVSVDVRIADDWTGTELRNVLLKQLVSAGYSAFAYSDDPQNQLKTATS